MILLKLEKTFRVEQFFSGYNKKKKNTIFETLETDASQIDSIDING